MKDALRDADQLLAEHMPPVTRRLFYGVFAGFLLFEFFSLIPFLNIVASRALILRADQAILQGHIWQFLLYPFGPVLSPRLMDRLLPMVFLLLGLFFLGRLIEEQMGGRRFLRFVLANVLLGGIVHVTYALVVGVRDIPMSSFYGPEMAIFAVIAYWFPQMAIRFMFFIPMQMRMVAIVVAILVALNVFQDIRMAGPVVGVGMNIGMLVMIPFSIYLVSRHGLLDWMDDINLNFRRGPKKVKRMGMGHPGRHSDPDDRYNDPHWRLDQ